MELRHLRYFVAVAETLHIGRAAARLGIAQPPLSVQIHDLEKELGTALFQRGPRGVTLTDAGSVFAQRAAAILAAAEDAMGAARDAAAGRGGRLVVGFLHSLAYSLLPGMLPSYRDAHPGVAIALREIAVMDKEEALLSNRIDVGLYRPPARHPEIEAIVLGEERMILALPSGHPLARRRRIQPSELRGERLVSFPAERGDAGLYGTVAQFLRRHAVEVQISEVAGTIHTALGLVLAGSGLAIVPESAALLRLPGIAYRPFESPARVQVAVCWRRGDRNGLTASFVTHVQARVRADPDLVWRYA